MALNFSAQQKPRSTAPGTCKLSISSAHYIRPVIRVHGIWERNNTSRKGPSPDPCHGLVGEEVGGQKTFERRMLLALLGGAMAAPALVHGGAAWAGEAAVATEAAADALTEITSKVYLDIGMAPTAFKADRTIGDKNVMPIDTADPVGRIVIGLYGNAAPTTVSNFLALIRSKALVNTAFSRVLPGEYIMAGQQGSKRLGQIQSPVEGVVKNPDTTSSSAFRLTHSRPGTVSLAMTENDEDPLLKEDPEYHNFEFLITTGPGPVPRLDGANIVFGRVLEGMGTVSTITTVPTFKPMERTAAMNMFAKAIGDERAVTVRRKYGKPLKAVLILGAGELTD